MDSLAQTCFPAGRWKWKSHAFGRRLKRTAGHERSKLAKQKAPKKITLENTFSV